MGIGVHDEWLLHRSLAVVSALALATSGGCAKPQSSTDVGGGDGGVNGGLTCAPWDAGASTIPWAGSDPPLTALHAAEQALAPHDPSRSLDVVNPDRGACAIRGGGGLFFAQVSFRSHADCVALCASFATSNPNRVCTWKGAAFFGDPQQACRVANGAGGILSSLPAATQSQCQTTCDGFQGDAYRTCDWGTERFQHPAPGTECRIRNGAGINVLVGFDAQTDCQAQCDARASDQYRSCTYGNVTLKTPDPAARCELLGGAGAMLAPVFHASMSDCATRCASFATSNPNRVCFYGAMRLP